MGGDRLCTGGIAFEGESKIWSVEKDGRMWCVGHSGTLRIGQLIRELAPLPEKAPAQDESLQSYLVRHWIPSVHALLKEAGVLRTKEGVELMALNLLVGVEENIFFIDGSLTVMPVTLSYYAIGSGGETAMGVLAALDQYVPTLDVPERIRAALAVASRHCRDVGSHVDLLEA
jgi:ATP-dependent protease HslVU (ClpYQ) peptidase subunit